jgi:hypothetical protein
VRYYGRQQNALPAENIVFFSEVFAIDVFDGEPQSTMPDVVVRFKSERQKPADRHLVFSGR